MDTGMDGSLLTNLSVVHAVGRAVRAHLQAEPSALHRDPAAADRVDDPGAGRAGGAFGPVEHLLTGGT